jgi:hypothetical protein
MVRFGVAMVGPERCGCDDPGVPAAPVLTAILGWWTSVNPRSETGRPV